MAPCCPGSKSLPKAQLVPADGTPDSMGRPRGLAWPLWRGLGRQTRRGHAASMPGRASPGPRELEGEPYRQHYNIPPCQSKATPRSAPTFLWRGAFNSFARCCAGSQGLIFHPFLHQKESGPGNIGRAGQHAPGPRQRHSAPPRHPESPSPPEPRANTRSMNPALTAPHLQSLIKMIKRLQGQAGPLARGWRQRRGDGLRWLLSTEGGSCVRQSGVHLVHRSHTCPDLS